VLNAIHHFVSHIDNAMFWPLLGLTFAGVGVLIQAADEREKRAYGSAEYADAKWRQWATVQGLAIGWLAYILLSAVPEPGYQVRTVVQEKIKVVNTATKYDDAFDMCLDNREETYGDSSEDFEICDRQARELVAPAVITKTKIVHDSYIDLYNACVGQWTLDGSPRFGEIRNERIALCHKQVQEVRASPPVVKE
jgi:hypothetical protein